MDKDYIDREAAIKKAQDRGKKDWTYAVHVVPEIESVLMATPTANVVQVVRCRECVNSCFFENCTNGICDRNGKRTIRKDDFCSYGERRCIEDG